MVITMTKDQMRLVNDDEEMDQSNKPNKSRDLLYCSDIVKNDTFVDDVDAIQSFFVKIVLYVYTAYSYNSLKLMCDCMYMHLVSYIPSHIFEVISVQGGVPFIYFNDADLHNGTEVSTCNEYSTGGTLFTTKNGKLYKSYCSLVVPTSMDNDENIRFSNDLYFVVNYKLNGVLKHTVVIFKYGSSNNSKYVKPLFRNISDDLYNTAMQRIIEKIQNTEEVLYTSNGDNIKYIEDILK